MDMRHFHDSLRRLKAMAQEAQLSGQEVSKLILPFIEEWKTVATPNRADGAAMSSVAAAMFSPTRQCDITAHVKTIGMNLVKAKLTGLRFHNAFQLHVATLATQFDLRGWTESAATFMDPDQPEATETSHGRIDVVWAKNRIPVAIFEIDSTVKPRSFAKLKEGLAPHKFWIYFGKDVWGFKSFLLQQDPGREIVPILIPHTFTPSFSDPAPQPVAPLLPRAMDN
jgi:hypothetical protein